MLFVYSSVSTFFYYYVSKNLLVYMYILIVFLVCMLLFFNTVDNAHIVTVPLWCLSSRCISSAGVICMPSCCSSFYDAKSADRHCLYFMNDILAALTSHDISQNLFYFSVSVYSVVL